MARRPQALDAATAALAAVVHSFDPAGLAAREAAIARASRAALHLGPALLRYHDLLLFVLAHPASRGQRQQVERELQRIAACLKAGRGRHPEELQSQGLPFVDTVTRYSHDFARWLLAHKACRVAIDGYSEPLLDLNAVLKPTLPALERYETTASLSNDDLLDALKVKPADRLRFIVDQLARLDHEPLVKDQLFDALDLFVRVSPTQRRFAKAWNRLPMATLFVQQERLRQFDARELMNRKLPPARSLDDAARAQAVEVLRSTMALTARETDPATYLDARSLRLFDLERGLTVAVFGMTPDRQLPLESYIGFTLFKNGLPVAYGGAWLLGPRAAFGMNIFEPYRGGESGYMMCQVLRSYRQAFGVRFFEVDAHQFGLDNPDGIATGAFWFYHRHGFRPLDPSLARLAEDERRRIARQAGHRSSEKTLIRLTGSNIALNFGGKVPTHLFEITTAVTNLIARRYGGDRARAEADCTARFLQGAGMRTPAGADRRRVLAEVALIAQATAESDPRRLALLRRMVEVKPVDVDAYQRLLLEYFADA
jgi:hypothetical protein